MPCPPTGTHDSHPGGHSPCICTLPSAFLSVNAGGTTPAPAACWHPPAPPPLTCSCGFGSLGKASCWQGVSEDLCALVPTLDA